MNEYGIAICNLNMAQTIEEALHNIVDPLDERFEVVVVDGGSTDGSLEILDRLSDEIDLLRYVSLPPESSRKLGVDRNLSILSTDTSHVIGALDVDEHYHPGIVQDFVEVYDQLDAQVGGQFVLHGSGMYVAPKELHEEYLFPNVARCEDRYFWMQLFENEDVIWLDHQSFGNETLGYNRGLLGQIRTNLEERTIDFQFGMSLASCIRWTLQPSHPYVLERRRGSVGTVLKRFYDLATYPLAYLRSIPRDSYEIPSQFRERGNLEYRMEQEAQWLSQIETEYGVNIDRDALSELGREVFFAEE